MGSQGGLLNFHTAPELCCWHFLAKTLRFTLLLSEKVVRATVCPAPVQTVLHTSTVLPATVVVAPRIRGFEHYSLSRHEDYHS